MSILLATNRSLRNVEDRKDTFGVIMVVANYKDFIDYTHGVPGICSPYGSCLERFLSIEP